MKAISTIIATSFLLASLGASAQSVVTGTDIIATQVAPTKTAAYELGMSKLAELKTISPLQLGQALDIPLGNIDESTIRFNDAGYITLQERMNANGQLNYVGQVNVSFSYVEHDSDK